MIREQAKVLNLGEETTYGSLYAQTWVRFNLHTNQYWMDLDNVIEQLELAVQQSLVCCAISLDACRCLQYVSQTILDNAMALFYSGYILTC